MCSGYEIVYEYMDDGESFYLLSIINVAIVFKTIVVGGIFKYVECASSSTDASLIAST